MKENLVTEGGGVKGVAFYGALKYMDEIGVLKNFKRFAGSSAGSIMAIVLACKFPMSKIQEVIVDTDFSTFKDDSWGVAKDVYRFLYKYGVYKGDAVESWIEGHLYRHTGIHGITLGQIYAKYGTEVVITGTCVNRRCSEYYHHSTHPDMKASDAVRISISIPFFFQAVQRPTLLGKSDTLVDGGVLNNYPIWVFNPNGTICTDKVKSVDNPLTLGLKLMANDERADDNLYHDTDEISDIVSFSHSLINCLMTEIERSHMSPHYWSNSIPISTGTVQATDFDLTQETKDTLIANGYRAAALHFSTHK